MYGILCATPEELSALRLRFAFSSQAAVHGPTRVWQGESDGQPVVLAQAGIGKVNAAAAATLLLSAYGADLLIFSGVAGGLNPELGIGSVVLGERLGIHDYGLVSQRQFTPTLSGVIPIGAPPLKALSRVPARVAGDLADLRDLVADRLEAPVVLGGIATADYFLNCAQTRDELFANLHADAIDMESGAVNQIAENWGIPLYVVRTLSDQAGEDSHLSYAAMAQMAAHNSALCVSGLLAILGGTAWNAQGVLALS